MTGKRKQEEPRVQLGAATPARDRHERAADHDRVERSIPVQVDGQHVATVVVVVAAADDGSLPVVSYGVTDHRS